MLVCRVPAGVVSVSVEGVTYAPDADGCVTVPDASESSLLRHGCTVLAREPVLPVTEDAVAQAAAPEAEPEEPPTAKAARRRR